MFLEKWIGVGISRRLSPILFLGYILSLSTLPVVAVIHDQQRPCLQDYICAEFYVCSNERVCECRQPNIEVGNMCLLTVQGSTCTQDQDCNTSNSQTETCKLRPCVCHETRCVLLRSGKHCLTSQSCSHIPNAECRDYVCECKANYTRIGRRCSMEGEIQMTATAKSSTTTIARSSTRRVIDESVARLNISPSAPALVPNRLVQYTTKGKLSPENNSDTVTERCPGNHVFNNGKCVPTDVERRSYWPMLGMVLGLFAMSIITTLVVLFLQKDPKIVTKKTITRSYVSETS